MILVVRTQITTVTCYF